MGPSASTSASGRRRSSDSPVVNEPDYAAVDRILPHPVYAKQRWISILNPSEATFRDVVRPLIDEAHERLANARARHAEPSAD